MNKFLSLITICVILAVANAGQIYDNADPSSYYAGLKLGEGEHEVKGSLKVDFGVKIAPSQVVEFASKELLQPSHRYNKKIFSKFPLDKLDHVTAEWSLPLLSKIGGSSADIHIDHLILYTEEPGRHHDLKFCSEDPSKHVKSGEKVKLTRCKV